MLVLRSVKVLPIPINADKKEASVKLSSAISRSSALGNPWSTLYRRIFSSPPSFERAFGGVLRHWPTFSPGGCSTWYFNDARVPEGDLMTRFGETNTAPLFVTMVNVGGRRPSKE